ncbi:MAG: Wzz/FepE/Etk N-terminal domain-containing protein [Bacteroidota bacterium]
MKLFLSLWRKRIFLTKVLLVFLTFGVIIALTSPKEYKTGTILIPENLNETSGFGGSFGGLAAIAGLDLGKLENGQVSINPALYQSVSRSTPFLLELLQESFYFRELDESISLEEYYYYHYKLGLFEKVMVLPSRLLFYVKRSFTSGGNKIAEAEEIDLVLSEDQQKMIDDLSGRVFVEMDWELNVLKIEVEMQDPIVAAKMALFTKNYITEYVSQYSTAKSERQLQTVENQFLKRKTEFEEAQRSLSYFRDRNRNVLSALAKSEEQKLQSQYDLAFGVYNQLAQQLEAVRLQLEDQRPIFTVLEPIKIPTKKSRPKRMLTVLIFAFVGIVVGSVYVFITTEENA